MMIDETFKKKLGRRVLSWYGGHRRETAWRNTDDPYKIWVSEIMLQQTQVRTVDSFYSRFIDRFPTVQILANAEINEVMKAWEGLGYYGRARHLHNAAKEIVRRFGGKIPDTMDDLLSLPGIGRYTAGAILSIAYHKLVPVLDGNVIRLLSRVFHIIDNVDKTMTQKTLWDIAERILPRKRISEFNQGLMELGALVCKQKHPVCNVCPLTDLCEARRLAIQQDLPVKSPRKPSPHYDVTAGIIWKNGKFLITLRPPKGLLGGLWEFPGGKCESGETLPECLRREILEELNIRIDVGDQLISVKHAYTHFRITLHAFECTFVGGKIQTLECDDYRWITETELDVYAFPAADRKIIQYLKEKTEV